MTWETVPTTSRILPINTGIFISTLVQVEYTYYLLQYKMTPCISTTPEHTTQKKSSNLFNNPDSKLAPLDQDELRLVDKYSSPDVYISGERDTFWHPWVNNLELKPLRFETRTGTFVIVLRAKEDTWLGKHRHRGNVTAVTLKGEWNYKELVPTPLFFPFLP